MQATERVWWLLGLIAAVGLGVIVQLWAAGQWAGNFNSDEAIFALMTRHILAGSPLPVYAYGASYLGAGESWIAAWLVDNFTVIESSVFGLRMGSVVLFGTFLLLQGWLTHYLWNWQIALVTSLFTAVPGAFILWWLYRPIDSAGLLLVCGTAALLLSLFDIKEQFLNYGRVFLVGALLGIGFWSHHLTIIYVVVIAILWLLQTPEWRHIYLLIPPFVWPLITMLLAVLVVFSFFAAACPLPSQTADLVVSAQVILLAIAGWSIVGFGWISERQLVLQWGWISLSSGLLVGSLPQLLAIANGQQRGISFLASSCPTDVAERGRVLVTELLPHIGGASWLIREGGGTPFYELGLSAIVLPLMLAAIAFFVWYWRYILGAIVSLRPLVKDDVKIILTALLFLLPLFFVLLNDDTVNVSATRYLLTSWQAAVIVFGWFTVYLVRTYDRNWLGGVFVALLLIHSGVGYVALNERWESNRFEPAGVAALEQFMIENSVYGGYADYTDTYTLNFLMNERVILTPIAGAERYQRYNSIVSEMPMNAYVFPRSYIEEVETETIDLLIQQLNSAQLPAGEPSAQLVEMLEGKEVVHREQIAYWDVWIVR